MTIPRGPLRRFRRAIARRPVRASSITRKRPVGVRPGRRLGDSRASRVDRCRPSPRMRQLPDRASTASSTALERRSRAGTSADGLLLPQSGRPVGIERRPGSDLAVPLDLGVDLDQTLPSLGGVGRQERRPEAPGSTGRRQDLGRGPETRPCVGHRRRPSHQAGPIGNRRRRVGRGRSFAPQPALGGGPGRSSSST